MESTGNAQAQQRDYGMQGDILIAVRQLIEQNRIETHEEIASAFSTLENQLKSVQGSRQPSKLDRIRDYLGLLYEARNCGHKVDSEIDDALQKYRTEADI